MLLASDLDPAALEMFRRAFELMPELQFGKTVDGAAYGVDFYAEAHTETLRQLALALGDSRLADQATRSLRAISAASNANASVALLDYQLAAQSQRRPSFEPFAARLVGRQDEQPG